MLLARNQNVVCICDGCDRTSRVSSEFTQRRHGTCHLHNFHLSLSRKKRQSFRISVSERLICIYWVFASIGYFRNVTLSGLPLGAHERTGLPLGVHGRLSRTNIMTSVGSALLPFETQRYCLFPRSRVEGKIGTFRNPAWKGRSEIGIPPEKSGDPFGKIGIPSENIVDHIFTTAPTGMTEGAIPLHHQRTS